nr:MAG TPA: hypothetical protein [Caudoviricetes sp.]
MVLSLFSSFLHQGRRGTFTISADGLSPCVSCITGRTLPVCTLPTLLHPCPFQAWRVRLKAYGVSRSHP